MLLCMAKHPRFWNEELTSDVVGPRCFTVAGLAPKLNQSNNIFATLLSMVGAIKQVCFMSAWLNNAGL
jgi:hypothetical protein